LHFTTCDPEDVFGELLVLSSELAGETRVLGTISFCDDCFAPSVRGDCEDTSEGADVLLLLVVVLLLVLLLMLLLLVLLLVVGLLTFSIIIANAPINFTRESEGCCTKG
jgi:hypothetical protein